jgi:hypothetical protein
MTSASSVVFLFGALVLGQAGEQPVHKAPAIKVQSRPDYDGPKGVILQQNFLLYHTIHWGLNYQRPQDKEDWGDPEKDFSRLPTTYYHPSGPLGLALQKFNWSPGAANTFHADARIIASLVGLGGQPQSQFASLWSEPPVAVLGMNIGTEAAYARPFQTLHFFERNSDIIALSQPPKGGPRYFGFIGDARARGAAVKVFPGEHRPAFAKEGGEKFYHLIVVETVKQHKHEHLHEDLLTKEGMRMLMSKLAEEGILCFHTSHRHLKVDQLVASVAKDLGYATLEGRPPYNQASRPFGYFSSEWVMVARKPAYLEHLKDPDGQDGYWRVPESDPRFVWKDGQNNSPAGLWRSSPFIFDLRQWVRQVQYPLAQSIGQKQAEVLFSPINQRLDGWERLVVQLSNR